MSDAMWGGRFDLPMDHLVQEFNATILIEKRVTPFSIIGSTAHVHMLAAQNILTQSEAEAILQGLQAVRQEVEDGKFVFNVADEDIQMAIERRVTKSWDRWAERCTRPVPATIRRSWMSDFTRDTQSRKLLKRSVICSERLSPKPSNTWG